MPNFYFVPIPQTEITEDEFTKIYKENLTTGSKNVDKWGVLPNSLLINENCKYFELAYLDSWQYQTIDGSISSVGLIRKIPLIIINYNLIAIGQPNSNTEEERIINFFRDKFIKKFVLQKMKFTEKMLEKTLHNDVIEISFQPTAKADSAIDKIKAKGRTNILNTNFIEEHRDKPIKETKFHIKSINEDISVEFMDKGVVKLPNNIQKEYIFLILTHIAEKIIIPEIIGKKFQPTLDFYSN